MGNILLSSGNYFDYDCLEENSYRIDDIAYALSNTCRFGGHCRPFYSVAEHSVYVSMMVEDSSEEHALAGLLHDAAEAYIGDMPKPLKIMLKDYCEYESRLEKVLFKSFGVAYPFHISIKEADKAMLKLEQKQLMANEDEWLTTEGVSLDVDQLLDDLGIWKMGLDPAKACQRFMDRYYHITGS